MLNIKNRSVSWCFWRRLFIFNGIF